MAKYTCMVALPKEEYEQLILSKGTADGGSTAVSDSKIANVEVREGGTVVIDQGEDDGKPKRDAGPDAGERSRSAEASADHSAGVKRETESKKKDGAPSAIRPRFFVGRDDKKNVGKAVEAPKTDLPEKVKDSDLPKADSLFTREDGRPIAKAARKLNTRKRKSSEEIEENLRSKRMREADMRRQMDMFVQRRLDQLHGRKRRPDYFRPLGPVVPEPMEVYQKPQGREAFPTPEWRRQLIEEVARDREGERPTMMEAEPIDLRDPRRSTVKRRVSAAREAKGDWDSYEDVPTKRGKEDRSERSSAKMAKYADYDGAFY